MVELDTFLTNGNQYKTAIDFLCYETMDPETDQHYEDELRKQVIEDQINRDMIHNLQSK
jgi:hypothetical protein